MIKAAPMLFKIVKDYADNADCGDGGNCEASKTDDCWHCQAVKIVNKIEHGRDA